MNLNEVSTARLIAELSYRGLKPPGDCDEPHETADLTLKFLNMTSSPAFFTLPEPWQRLLTELGDELRYAHTQLDQVGAPARDTEVGLALALTDRIHQWQANHPDCILLWHDAMIEIDSLKREIESRNHFLEFWRNLCNTYKVREETTVSELADQKAAYDTLLNASQHLAKQSTGAHEAMDTIGVPVCGLQVQDRMKCLIKMHNEALTEKDKEIEACRQTMVRLAHEAKHRFLDGK